ncbi:glycosyltransferase family 2 protein [Synergistaceae bacterium OttesenSCG-928-I11]|nr:glycosyltransferase family 2 protein [Synergistaceae bacterium OttesenSCG-928-I11]
MATVSIVLPTYNGERYIRTAIESIINQSFEDWELIIVNDGSTDCTEAIINEYKSQDDRIVIITNEVNKNLPASLNAGFSVSRGKYLTWTSDDNYYKKEALAFMVNFLDGNSDVDLVCCSHDILSDDHMLIENENDFSKNRQSHLIFHCNIGACFLYTKSIAKKVGDYDVSMFCAEDYDYWLRIALEGKIVYVDRNLYTYCLNPSSLSATKREVIKKKTTELQLKYLDLWLKKFNLSSEERAELFYKLLKKTRKLSYVLQGHAADRSYFWGRILRIRPSILE